MIWHTAVNACERRRRATTWSDFKAVWGFAALSALALAVGCSRYGSGTSPSPTPVPSNPTSTTTITISNDAVSPKAIVVPQGSQVMFVNSDTRPHEMNSNPHPEHTDCPEINQVGFLNPGQSRQTGNLIVAKTCGYHDHDAAEVQSLQGTITIQ